LKGGTKTLPLLEKGKTKNVGSFGSTFLKGG
jgi:hypothetical protein